MTVINGVDLSELKEDTPKLHIPKVVPGRVVHIDGDFIAYMVSAGQDKTLSDMKHNTREWVSKIKMISGSEDFVLHLTCSTGDKGGRYEQAMLKEYQYSRKDRQKPKYLHVIKDWMVKELGAENHKDCEADDAMAIAQYEALSRDEGKLCVISSKDKDLCMVPGLQINWDTGVFSDTLDHFGYIKVDDTKSTKKVVGRGWAFFWAQMLMGDPADNVSGIPLIVNPDYVPGKPKKCGPMLTYDILGSVQSNEEAFHIVRDAYKDYAKYCEDNDLPGFVNFRDESPITWTEAFFSEARLLWMRRNKNHDDVIEWIKEECR